MPAEDIGCNNETCIRKDECQRQVIYKNGTAREIKKFGGTPQKGCGKFLEKPKKSRG
jgi:hypothetical protein